MRHPLIYLASGSAMLFVLSGIFMEHVQTKFAPYTAVVNTILILLGIGVPFAAISLFRVRENPHILDRLFDLQIAKRKPKGLHPMKHYLIRRKNQPIVSGMPKKRHPQLKAFHHRRKLRPAWRKGTKRKRDNANDYAYPRAAQKEIVEKYWEARKRGEVENRDAWASRYNISGRTLRTYEKAYLAEINGNKTR